MQTKKHFDDFWDEAILPAIEQALEEMSPDFCAEGSVGVQNLFSYKADLEKVYRRKREWLKTAYLPHESHPYLDFHKLAAIVCRSIIGNKPIRYNVPAVKEIIQQQGFSEEEHDEQICWFVNNVYVNYKIAFLSAIGIVYANIIHWALQKKEVYLAEKNSKFVEIYEQFISLLLAAGHLCSYTAPQTHENYENSVIIALMKNDLLQRDFDYLNFAINLYQLEYFTKLTLFHQVIKDTNYTIDDIDLS